MDAKDYPVNQPQREFESGDVKIRQRKARNIDTFDGKNESEIAIADGLDEGDEAYQAELSFMEEPMTIRIHPGTEKNPPKVVQCWVNGQGAMVLDHLGKWRINGWLPVGLVITTRRKFVEVLARAKDETVSTKVVKHDTYEDNLAERFANLKHAFSVIKDDNPKGHEWLSNILMEQ